MKRSNTLMVLMLMSLLSASALADPPPAVTYPAWWIPHVAPAQPSYATQPEYEEWIAGNYAAANLGQLKNIAKQAKAYLDARLSHFGGAGTELNSLVTGFDEFDEGDPLANYAALNIGQLKYVTKKFFDRLQAVGLNTNAFLKSRGYPSGWTDDYPWDSETPVPVAENYAVANLGQLKLAFAFDLSATSTLMDSDSDGLPDWWELAFFGDLSQTASGNPDGDGSNNGAEFSNNTVPVAAISLTIAMPTPNQEL